MFNRIIQVFRIPELRKKILIVLGLLVVFRVLASIPIPGVNIDRLSALLEGNQLLGFLNIFSGDRKSVV